MFFQGYPKGAENNLDVAITGNGFFQIELPDGNIAYTRTRSFKLDNNGNVVNAESYGSFQRLRSLKVRHK